jgi:hypothetical protein
VPIIESTNYTEATGLLTNIIDDVATNAPSEGEVTNINMSDFNLNNIVPKRPFFTYTGLDINSHSSDFIVFGQLEGIPLNSDTLNTLYQIIKECPLPTPGTDLFVNSKGPNVKKNDGIYGKIKRNLIDNYFTSQDVDYLSPEFKDLFIKMVTYDVN